MGVTKLLTHYRHEWAKHIPDKKLVAYKYLIDEGLIMNVHVTYVRTSKLTVVEFDSELTKDEIKGKVSEVMKIAD